MRLAARIVARRVAYRRQNLGQLRSDAEAAAFTKRDIRRELKRLAERDRQDHEG